MQRRHWATAETIAIKSVAGAHRAVTDVHRVAATMVARMQEYVAKTFIDPVRVEPFGVTRAIEAFNTSPVNHRCTDEIRADSMYRVTLVSVVVCWIVIVVLLVS